ncbi:hypothetical protein [Glycomyces sp. YM15]|uniref:hypothetical protein n=1 Tax=Glycomyces sp. YM15 TaxID=2800446 RepID=UPI001962A54F|nr:hypothetical protein [Glycomyces sp. YM15]
MDPINVDGSAPGFVALNILVVVLVAACFVYGVVVVMAALGLTSFSIFERFRRKPQEETEDGGIDDLF